MQRYKISSEFSQVKHMATHLHAFCQSKQIGESLAGVLELILVEALNNVIEHAYKNQPGNDIEVNFSIEDQTIIMQINDYGLSIPEHLQNAEQMPDSELLPEGGWGLGLINTLSDSVSFTTNDGMNTATLSKNLSN